MTSYLDTDTAASKAGEEKDCAVRAVAVMLDLDYQFALGMFRAFGRKPGKGTPTHMTLAVLNQLDWHGTPYKVTGKRVKDVEKELDAHGLFLVQSTRHIHCVKHGVSEDWTAGSRKLVTEVWRIERWHCKCCNTISCVSKYRWPGHKFFRWPDGGFFSLDSDICEMLDKVVTHRLNPLMKTRKISVCKPCFDQHFLLCSSPVY